jgi:hypothetical protein
LPSTMKASDQIGCPSSLGAMAGRGSTAAVGEGQRAGQGVARNLEAAQEGVLALPQARGGPALGR